MADIRTVGVALPRVPEGVHAGDELQAPEFPELEFYQWSPKALLQTQLGQTHDFFTPALMYQYLPLEGRDPYREFCAAHDVREKMLLIDFGIPLFDPFPKGVNHETGDPAAHLPWQTSLCALTKETWRQYREFLGRLTILDRSREEIFLVTCTQLVIVDPVFFYRATVLPEQLPLLPIGAVTFWSKQFRVYFRVRTKTPWRPTPVVMEPQTVEEHSLLLKALLSEHPNPYEFVESRGEDLPREALLYRRAVEMYHALRKPDESSASQGGSNLG